MRRKFLGFLFIVLVFFYYEIIDREEGEFAYYVEDLLAMEDIPTPIESAPLEDID